LWKTVIFRKFWPIMTYPKIKLHPKFPISASPTLVPWISSENRVEIHRFRKYHHFPCIFMAILWVSPFSDTTTYWHGVFSSKFRIPAQNPSDPWSLAISLSGWCFEPILKNHSFFEIFINFQEKWNQQPTYMVLIALKSPSLNLCGKMVSCKFFVVSYVMVVVWWLKTTKFWQINLTKNTNQWRNPLCFQRLTRSSAWRFAMPISWTSPKLAPSCLERLHT